MFKNQNSNRDSYFFTKTINWTITRKKYLFIVPNTLSNNDAYTTWKFANYFSCFWSICCSYFFISGNSYFCFVSTSLEYTTIPKNKRKTKITWDKNLTTTYSCADIRLTFLWAQFEHFTTARFTWIWWRLAVYSIVWFIWLWNSKSPINQDFNSINVYRKWKN